MLYDDGHFTRRFFSDDAHARPSTAALTFQAQLSPRCRAESGSRIRRHCLFSAKCLWPYFISFAITLYFAFRDMGKADLFRLMPLLPLLHASGNT